MNKIKTAADFDREHTEAAEKLSVETKKIFHKALFEDGKNVGEARELAGIDDIMTAAKLVILLHNTIHIPMRAEDIK